MKKSISLSDFAFGFEGAGHCKVTYYSRNTNKWWTALITDMILIDATKNADQPKIKDLNRLKTVVKRKAIEY